MRNINFASIHHMPWLEYRHALPDGRVCLRLQTGRGEFTRVTAKVTSNYEIGSDIHTPSASHDIKIYAPTYPAGKLADTASTRVTVVVPKGEENYDVYFRVLKASELTNGVQALDPKATNWYKAGNVVTEGQNYGSA